MNIEETKVKEETKEPGALVEEKKKRGPRANKVDFLFSEELYADEKYKATHKIKCKVRAAKVYGVTIEHLDKAYFDLNGKKLDGIYITELIDRFGFSDGRQLSRAQLANKYGYGLNITPIDVAENKLRSILQSADIKKAYATYLKDIKDEFIKETNDKAVYGE